MLSRDVAMLGQRSSYIRTDVCPITIQQLLQGPQNETSALESLKSDKIKEQDYAFLAQPKWSK